jgi:hypothetical protein
MVAVNKAAETAAEIRPGVFRPDWSAVTKLASREALNGRAAARVGLLDQWTKRLGDEEDLVWRTILRLYAKFGAAPPVADLAAATGIGVDKLTSILPGLETRDLIGLDHSSGAIRLAYPFTETTTGHCVDFNGHALCAIDALGVASMYGVDTVITSLCRHCGGKVQVSITAADLALTSVTPPDAVVWYDFTYNGRAAQSCCPSIAFFCSRQHLERWLGGQAGRPEGMCLTMDEALEVGRAIFGPILTEPATCAAMPSPRN